MSDRHTLWLNIGKRTQNKKKWLKFKWQSQQCYQSNSSDTLWPYDGFNQWWCSSWTRFQTLSLNGCDNAIAQWADYAEAIRPGNHHATWPAHWIIMWNPIAAFQSIGIDRSMLISFPGQVRHKTKIPVNASRSKNPVLIQTEPATIVTEHFVFALIKRSRWIFYEIYSKLWNTIHSLAANQLARNHLAKYKWRWKKTGNLWFFELGCEMLSQQSQLKWDRARRKINRQNDTMLTWKLGDSVQSDVRSYQILVFLVMWRIPNDFMRKEFLQIFLPFQIPVWPPN